MVKASFIVLALLIASCGVKKSPAPLYAMPEDILKSNTPQPSPSVVPTATPKKK